MTISSPLLISHVPKTAGSSLKRLVSELWPDSVFAYKGELSLLEPRLDLLQELRASVNPSIIMGHFSFGAHRFLGVKPRYAIVLREPLSRVVSLYRYQRSLPNSPFLEFFKRNYTIREFVSSGITEMTNNHMCRMIAGVAPDAGKKIQDRWLLEHALHNLKTYYEAVGIQEEIDLFLKRIAEIMGVGKLSMTRENVTLGVPVELDRDTKNTVEEMNALDLELYDVVRRMSLHHAGNPSHRELKQSLLVVAPKPGSEHKNAK